MMEKSERLIHNCLRWCKVILFPFEVIACFE